jgi:DNA-binding response OmpR family regulator
MAFVVAALHTAETRQLVKALLAEEGHTCAIFGTGGAAVRESLAGAPDLLIIESRLADLSASQVRDAVRSQASTAAIPIVVCDPTDVSETPTHTDADGRLFRTAPTASGLRAAVAAALTTGAGDPPPRRRHETTEPVAGPAEFTGVSVRPHPVPPRVSRRTTPPARADVTPPARAEDPAMRVLLVEDDASIAEPLIEGLARYGFLVDWMATGAAALSAPPAAMVLLDLGLPDIDGLEVCRRLLRTADTSVIMLTARGDECDRVVGLELGADDYLAKPFSLRELVARMRAVSRRTRPAPAVGARP